MNSFKRFLVVLLWLLDWNRLAVNGFDLSKTLTRAKPNFGCGGKVRTNSVRLESGDPDVATRPRAQSIDDNLLSQLDDCTTGTSARRLLEQALSIDEPEATKPPLFGSIQITPGISDKTISDGDLAIQTKVRNKKYGIFELVDTNGDRDADRIAAAVFGVFVGSSLSAIAVNENMPGPEILRFTLVWLLSFAPL